MLKKIKGKINRYFLKKRFHSLYKKYSSYTMIPSSVFVGNLMLLDKMKHVKGCVVECGVWRGGMSAAIAEVLGNRRSYFLFDSFEGLPPAKEIDGAAALAWQNDKGSSTYYENCKAEASYAEQCMKLANAEKLRIVQGWFSDTLPQFKSDDPIALLRLDGDWYDSTMDCLKNLYPKVAPGGLIIIDDYYAWEGCSRAVHDYLSQNSLPVRIRENEFGVCYLIKF